MLMRHAYPIFIVCMITFCACKHATPSRKAYCICLYLRHRGMTPPPASQGGAASHARFAGVSPLLRSSDCFRLVFAHSADHNPPYPPLVSALRLVCCLRVQILVVPLHVYTCSHRVFTHGAPCMGLLGPCRLKFFPRQSIYYHTL